MKKISLFTLLYTLLTCGLVFSQSPVNDNCSNAVPISVGASCVLSNHTSLNATSEPTSVAPNPTCVGYSGGDVWFTAVMPASGALRVETTAGGINPQVAVYSGTCGAFTQLFCMQLDNDRTYNNPALAGQTVYIRIYTYGTSAGGTFNICLWEPPVPVNDNCADALPLTVGAACSMSNFTNAYATSQPTSVATNPTCVGYSGGDIWFTAIMPASGVLRVETSNGTINPQVAVYSGTCGAFTQLFCMQLDNDRTFNNPALAGQTIYIRVYNYGNQEGGTFNICLWEPPVPVNDNCADALPLTVGAACSMSNFTNAYTTSQPTSVAPNPNCVGYSGGDIWFTAIMPASGVLRVETSNGTINPQVAVYSGTCGAFTQLFCMQLDNDRTFNNPALAGQTIYIRVYNYGNQEGGTFNICLWEPPVPVNDNCANATALPIGTNCVMSGFTNAYASAEPSSIAPNPSCGFYQGGDVWFTAVMPASGILRVETSNGTINPQVAVYSGTCGAFTQLFCMQLDNDRTYHNLALAGQTVYIRVYNYGSEEGGTFNICLWEPPVPVNDNCASAIALPIGTNCVMSGFTNAYASAEPTSVAPNPSCGFYQGGDVWFTLVMPATGVLTLQRTNISGVNAQFALYSGSCGSFTQIACAQLTTTMNVADTSLAGQTLYLRVYNYNSEEGGTFSICGFDPSCLASITTVNANQASCPTESDGSVEIIATCTNCQGGARVFYQ